MLDKQLYILVRQLLSTKVPLRGLTSLNYFLRYQPTQQGRPTDATVWMHKVSDKRYGYAQIEQRDIGGVNIQRTETVAMETTFKFSVTQPPAMQDNELTHGDVLKVIMGTLQSRDAQDFLIANGASVLRVGVMQTIFINNDRNQHEESPTFDLTFKHNDVFVDGQPFITKFNFKVVPVPNLA